MPFIKLVNQKYDNYQSLHNLLTYIMNCQKTCVDSKRAGYVKDFLYCCKPFWFPYHCMYDPSYVSFFFCYCIFSLHPFAKNYALHRIVSFSPGDYIFPEDAFNLGGKIADYYNKTGHIVAYAVHCDTYNIHLHIVVCPVNLHTGNLYNNYYELDELQALVSGWCSLQDQRIERNPRLKERYENRLFGDDLKEAAAFNITKQIQINRSIKNS